METLTFNQLPEAVTRLLEKVDHIETLLTEHGTQQAGPNQPINIKEAADFLDLAVPTVYSKVSRKEIPVNKQGKRLYFYKSELEEWIRQGRKQTFSELRDSIVLPRRTYSKNRKSKWTNKAMRKLNCDDARKLSIVDYLAQCGFRPQYIKGVNHWYLSPIREENTASFKVNTQLNVWFDHGMGSVVIL